MKKTISSEICTICAGCCRNYPFVELTEDDILAIEHVTGLRSEDFTHSKGSAGKAPFLQLQESGDCIFLSGNKGRYSCGVYKARPRICKDYPCKPKQREACDANQDNLPDSDYRE